MKGLNIYTRLFAIIALSLIVGFSTALIAPRDTGIAADCPNLLSNGGLETGNAAPWAFWQPAGTVTVVNSNAYEGNYAIELTGGEASAEYLISGLLPNTDYKFSGYAYKTNNANGVVFGVKNYGGAQLTTAVTASSYAKDSIMFTTGSANTSVKLFFYSSALSGFAYGDNFSLQALSCGTTFGADDYYIDATGGNDSNDGLSPAAAWQTFDNVNTNTFLPGTNIFLKCGEVWNAPFRPISSGTANAPIIIDRYGNCTDDTNKPHIAAEGQFPIPVHLYNVEYIEVNNLQVSNNTPNGTEYTGAHGIFAELRDFGTAEHIYIRNCYIHDIDGNNIKQSQQNGLPEGFGIRWDNGGGIISTFNDLRIENNVLETVDRNGIKGGGYWDRTNWHPSTNVIIRGNQLTDIGGDGIVIIATDGALVEYNILKYFRMRPPLTQRDCSAGIWSWSADNTIFQYNESAYGWGKDNWGCDAQAFDADANCVNTIFQYNYSHHNDGGFALVINYEEDAPASVKLSDVVFRYNISVNDGAYKKRLIQMTGAYEDCYFYNNVFYMETGQDINIFELGTWPDGYPLSTAFYNNIFYLTNGATATYNTTGMTNIDLSNNIFYGAGHTNLASIVSNPNVANPLFVAPGIGANINDLDGFKLQSNSPAINAGLNLTTLGLDIGATDFFGDASLSGSSQDIGVAEFTVTQGCLPLLEITDDLIPDNTYIADTIRATGRVPNAGTVMMKAEVQVFLDLNFEVSPGAEFEAIIEDCQ